MRFTIFTPTYNRAHTLPNLYESLLCQTYKDFEWVVVDDGSSDDTNELIHKWQIENNGFQIRYKKKKNGGKCSAINDGLNMASGELFYVVDSDDWLVENALEVVDKWFKTIISQDSITGVVTNRGSSISGTSNYFIPEGFKDITMLDLYKLPCVSDDTGGGERDCIFYTSFFKKYPFPVFKDERFLTEAVVYNRMAHDGYKVRIVNDITSICNYQDDGLTKAGNKLFIQNPHGYGLCLKEKALFTNSKKIDILKLYYTFTCELSPYYDSKTIAECIGTSQLIILLCQFMHSIRNGVKELIC